MPEEHLVMEFANHLTVSNHIICGNLAFHLPEAYWCHSHHLWMLGTCSSKWGAGLEQHERPAFEASYEEESWNLIKMLWDQYSNLSLLA